MLQNSKKDQEILNLVKNDCYKYFPVEFKVKKNLISTLENLKNRENKHPDLIRNELSQVFTNFEEKYNESIKELATNSLQLTKEKKSYEMELNNKIKQLELESSIYDFRKCTKVKDRKMRHIISSFGKSEEKISIKEFVDGKGFIDYSKEHFGEEKQVNDFYNKIRFFLKYKGYLPATNWHLEDYRFDDINQEK